jgi:Flp pilus assembly pilin Flp
MQLIESMSRAMTRFVAEETGTSVMEYILVGLLCAIVGILALLALGKNI